MSVIGAVFAMLAATGTLWVKEHDRTKKNESNVEKLEVELDQHVEKIHEYINKDMKQFAEDQREIRAVQISIGNDVSEIKGSLGGIQRSLERLKNKE